MMPVTIGFLAKNCHTLAFGFTITSVWQQHKAEASVLLAVFDACCKQSGNMVAAAGEHVVY